MTGTNETTRRASNMIVPLPDDVDAAFFADATRVAAFIAKVDTIVGEPEHDLTTDKGRKAVASLAASVARTKTALDAHGKAITDEWREQTNAVNAGRKTLRDALDAKKEDIRAPLTAYEDAEKQRRADTMAALDSLRALARPAIGRDVDRLRADLSQVGELLQRDFGSDLADATALADEARAAINAAIDAAVEQAKRDEELAELRAEAARREQEDRERAAEERRATEAAKAEAEAKAREEIAAKAAREAAEREAAEKIAAVEREAEAERERIEQKRRDAEAAEAREIAKAEARAKNAANRKRKLGAIARSLVEECGLDAAQAENVADALGRGVVPNVTVAF